MKKNKYLSFTLLSVLLFIQACATNYTTPAAGVDISEINDVDIAEIMAREPQAKFPARVAILRIQSSDYSTATNTAYGTGKYSVLTTRDAETDESFNLMKEWQGVQQVAPIGRVLLPKNLQSTKDIRLAAASLKTDVVMLYSIDTKFHIEGQPLGPLSLISLGFIPNQNAHVTSTTAGALIDVRTGYIYGVAEATDRQEQLGTIWSTLGGIDGVRLETEAGSFQKFMQEAEKLFANTSSQYTVER